MTEAAERSATTEKHAFVLDRAGVERPSLRRALDRAGLTYTYAVPNRLDRPIQDQILEGIRQSDLILLVIDDGGVSPATLFEAGMAFALSIPMAVIDGRFDRVRGPEAAVIDTFVPLPRLFVNLDNEDGLFEQLDAFMSGEKEAQKALDEASSGDGLRVRGHWRSTGWVRSHVRHKDEALEVEIVDRFSRIVQREGGRLVSELAGEKQRGQEPDFILRFPDLDDSVVVVEVKPSMSMADSAQMQLSKFIGEMRRPGIGLIVTDEPEGEPVLMQLLGPGSMSAIVAAPIKWLEDSSFGLSRLLTSVRNLLVHGG